MLKIKTVGERRVTRDQVCFRISFQTKVYSLDKNCGELCNSCANLVQEFGRRLREKTHYNAIKMDINPVRTCYDYTVVEKDLIGGKKTSREVSGVYATTGISFIMPIKFFGSFDDILEVMTDMQSNWATMSINYHYTVSDELRDRTVADLRASLLDQCYKEAHQLYPKTLHIHDIWYHVDPTVGSDFTMAKCMSSEQAMSRDSAKEAPINALDGVIKPENAGEELFMDSVTVSYTASLETI